MTEKELLGRIRIIYGGYMLMEHTEKNKADFERLSRSLFDHAKVDIHAWQDLKRKALG